MTNTNIVVLKGNLTRGLDEHSFSYLSSGTARANVSIAVNRSRKNGDQWVDEASFFDVTIWGKTAENLKPYLVKGASIVVSGYLKQDRWEKDGQKLSRVYVVAETVELCGKREGTAANNAASNNSGNIQQNNNSFNNDNDNGFGSYDGMEIPF